MPRERFGILLLSTVLLLALSGCAGPAPGSGPPPGDGGPGPQPPGGDPRPRSPGDGGLTPARERVVGFPALFQDQHPEEEREAEAEARRVTVMHERGGTGQGQVVGTIESGANLEHPDLREKFAHICAMGRCDDGRPNRSDHSPLHDTNGHGTVYGRGRPDLEAASRSIGSAGIASGSP